MSVCVSSLSAAVRLDWFAGGFYELQYFRRKHKHLKGKVLQMERHCGCGFGNSVIHI